MADANAAPADKSIAAKVVDEAKKIEGAVVGAVTGAGDDAAKIEAEAAAKAEEDAKALAAEAEAEVEHVYTATSDFLARTQTGQLLQFTAGQVIEKTIGEFLYTSGAAVTKEAPAAEG